MPPASLLVIGAIITVVECSLPLSFCNTNTGLIPPSTDESIFSPRSATYIPLLFTFTDSSSVFDM